MNILTLNFLQIAWFYLLMSFNVQVVFSPLNIFVKTKELSCS